MDYKKSKSIAVKVTPDFYERVTEAAWRQRTSISMYVQEALESSLKDLTKDKV